MSSQLTQPRRKSSMNVFSGLAIVMLIFGFVALLNGSFVAQVEAANLVANPGFESGALSPWGNWNNSVVASNARTGTYSMRVGTATGSGEQVIGGLSPNTAYVLTGWVKTSSTSVTGQIGAKNFGGTEVFQTSTSTTYTQRTINFTTGPSGTSVLIYCYKPTTSGYIYCDDLTLDVAAGSPTSTRTNTPVATATPTNTPTSGTNYVSNPGFETGSLSPWGQWNDVAVVNNNARTGTYALRVGNAQASSEQTVSGLSANTTYTLRGWAKTVSGKNIIIGVKNYGGSEQQSNITATAYTQATINFTTGGANTSAVIFCYSSSGAGNAYCDDFSVTAGGAPPTATPTWNLVWSDEFNGTTIDTSKWGYEIGLIRNNEAQYYTSRPENSYLDGAGNLVIKAIRENYQGAAYTSASLNTKGKASWTYGKFEMRGRIPTALGTWPAWWGLGTNIDTVGWPASGEIDMMEFYRSISLYNVMDGNQQWFGYNEAFTDSTNYHTWVMEWNSASNIKLYRDGVLKLTYTGGHVAFTRPFYMLANLAIGGTQGGNPAGTTFPQYYYIDYIRVYQH